MKIQIKAGWKLTAILLVSAMAAFGQVYNQQQTQTQPPNMSAARSAPLPPEVGPGMITYAEGQASIDGQPLSPHSETTFLNPGQVLNTSANGFVELLFAPDAYLRIGHNSDVRMISAGLLGTKAQLLRGTAMLEVDQLNDGTELAVEMRGATTEIQKRGLYDFNMERQAIRVLDGKAVVTEASGTTTLGRGHEVLLGNAEPLKARKFDEREVRNGQLFAWSKARSKELMEANQPQYAANGGLYAPGLYWGGPYWNSFTLGSGYPYGPWGYSPFYYGGYYVPLYRGYYYVHPYRGGHSYSQRELNNRVHNLFSGHGGGSHGARR